MADKTMLVLHIRSGMLPTLRSLSMPCLQQHRSLQAVACWGLILVCVCRGRRMWMPIMLFVGEAIIRKTMARKIRFPGQEIMSYIAEGCMNHAVTQQFCSTLPWSCWVYQLPGGLILQRQFLSREGNNPHSVKTCSWQTPTRIWNMISSPATPTVCVLSRSLRIFKVATWHLLTRHCNCNLLPETTSPKHEYRGKLWDHPVTSSMT